MLLELNNEVGGEVRRRTYEFRAKADGDTATIAGHASVFGSLNSHGEVFVEGAFENTIKDRDGSKPLIMGLHHKDAIGRWTVRKEDEVGLYLEGPISGTTAGKDASILARDGVLTGLSVGFWPRDYQFADAGERVTFSTPRGERSYQFEEPVIYILRADLAEASLVIAPSDDNARLVEVRSVLAQARKALPALRDESAAWEDVAYSMALLMGGRGSAAFSELPAQEHRALYDNLASAYERHGKTPPTYAKAPEYRDISFNHDEKSVFTDRYLRKTLDSLVAGVKGADGPLSVATREAAEAAIEALTPLTRDRDQEDRERLSRIADQLNQAINILKEGN